MVGGEFCHLHYDGGNQRTFNFVATWTDKVPTLADVPAGGSIVNVCKALKMTISGQYLLKDLPTRTATGNWNGTKCIPPRIEFDFSACCEPRPAASRR